MDPVLNPGCVPVTCPGCGAIFSHARRDRLTARERLMVSLIVDEGLSNKEIAARFDLGLGTVKECLRIVFLKLGVSGRVELAVLWHTEIFQLGLAS